MGGYVTGAGNDVARTFGVDESVDGEWGVNDKSETREEVMIDENKRAREWMDGMDEGGWLYGGELRGWPASRQGRVCGESCPCPTSPARRRPIAIHPHVMHCTSVASILRPTSTVYSVSRCTLAARSSRWMHCKSNSLAAMLACVLPPATPGPFPSLSRGDAMSPTLLGSNLNEMRLQGDQRLTRSNRCNRAPVSHAHHVQLCSLLPNSLVRPVHLLISHLTSSPAAPIREHSQ